MKHIPKLSILAALAVSGDAFAQHGEMKGMDMKNMDQTRCMEMKGMDMQKCME